MDTHKPVRFRTVFLSVILLLAALLLAGLFLLQQYAAAFDRAFPGSVAQRYAQAQLAEDLASAVETMAAEAGPYETEEAVRAALQEALEAPLTCGESDETAPGIYPIRCGTQTVGTLTAAPGPGGRFGLEAWQVERVEWDVSALTHGVTILAPSGAQVRINGQPLSTGQQTGERVWYPELEVFADSLPEDAAPVVYEVSGLYGRAEVTGEVDGQPCTAVTEESGRVLLYPPVPEGLEEELLDRADRFLRDYLDYANKISGGPGTAASQVVPGSELAYRLYAAVDGLVWVRPGWSTVSDIRVDSFRYFGAFALCQGHYTVEIQDDDEILHNDMKLLLTETDAGWRIGDLETF
ncbi:MAG: hypothetical protein SOY37_09690 [Oscillospiraceae bacterium]|nr:hypothetical protein [Oscillospiraceae bacterium]